MDLTCAAARLVLCRHQFDNTECDGETVCIQCENPCHEEAARHSTSKYHGKKIPTIRSSNRDILLQLLGQLSRTSLQDRPSLVFVTRALLNSTTSWTRWTRTRNRPRVQHLKNQRRASNQAHRRVASSAVPLHFMRRPSCLQNASALVEERNMCLWSCNSMATGMREVQ